MQGDIASENIWRICKGVPINVWSCCAKLLLVSNNYEFWYVSKLANFESVLKIYS